MAQSKIPVEIAKPPRISSVDALRGFVMLCMAAHGFGIDHVNKLIKDSQLWSWLPNDEVYGRYWKGLVFHTNHVPWEGCSFWDLIQPTFMFLVGTSMAYSYARRKQEGQPYLSMFFHALWRALLLVAIGIFLRSNGHPQTRFTFEDVTTQIGLGYVFLFLLWNRSFAVQFGSAVFILVAYWALFFFCPLPPENFDYSTVGLDEKWAFLDGPAAHWQKNANPAHYADVVFLNWFPQRTFFKFNAGGYQTLNFVPSLATMIFGLITGEYLRARRSNWLRFLVLAIVGAAFLGLGWLLHQSGYAPVIKPIWTPSWAIYSTGWVLVMLAGFYLVCDCFSLGFLLYPFRAVGANSIAIYVMSWLMSSLIAQSVKTHLGAPFVNWLTSLPFWSDGFKDLWANHHPENVFQLWGLEWEPLVHSLVVVLVLWIIAILMHRNKIFIRV